MNANARVMNIETAKLELMHLLLQTQKESLIIKLRKVFEEEQELPSYEIPESHKAILDKRLAAHEANPNDGRSWKDVKTDLKAKYGL